MNFSEYWIGENIDLENIWQIFDEGKGYIEKYKSMEVYMLQLQFDSPSNLPLFDYEAISKTIKSLFHDLKRECLSSSEYNRLGPIFLYEINRGSAIWSFLAELSPIIILGYVLFSKWLDLDNKSLDNLDKRMSIAEKLKKHFPQATDIDIQKFIKASNYRDRNRIIKRLYDRGLKKIKIYRKPFKGEKEIEFIHISEINEETK